MQSLGRLEEYETSYFEAAKREVAEETGYTENEYIALEKQEYVIKIEKKKSVKRNDQNKKDFKEMKFYLAKLRDNASAELYLETEVAESEKELSSYKWLNLIEAKQLWDHNKDSTFGEFKEYRNMMEWAEKKIREPNTFLEE